MGLGGASRVRVLGERALIASSTKRWSKLNECVTEPHRWLGYPITDEEDTGEDRTIAMNRDGMCE